MGVAERVAERATESVQGTDDPKNTRGGNNTAVSLANNAGLPLLMAGLQMSTITWLQCLQNSGAFLPHPVCKTKRPIPIAQMGRTERKRYWGYDFGLEEEDDRQLEEAPEGVDILPLTRDIGVSPPPLLLSWQMGGDRSMMCTRQGHAAC